MSPRRLLIVCYFYPPLGGGGVHRVLGFTRHLPARGWECTVVCAGPEDYWVVDPTLLRQVPAATEVVRVPGGSGLAAWLRLRRGERGRRPGGVFAGLRALSDWFLLPDSYAGWSRRARGVVRRLASEGRFDALLSSSPPDSAHLAARDARGSTRLPWVADFRDPWIGLTSRTPPTPWHRGVHRRMESSIVDGADVVLAASRTHADHLVRAIESRGGDSTRVMHLPNGFEPDPDCAVPGDGTPGPHFLIAFTGVLSLMPDVEVFLEAVHDLLARRPEARRRLRARLAGPYDGSYADRAVALGLTGIVEFTGPIPHAEARALQRRAQMLLLWQPRDFPTMVPGKLYEYLESGTPVVALLDPGFESARLLARGGGTVVPVGDRAELAAEIERHYLAWREGAALRATPPDWLEEHRRPRLAARLAERLDALVGGRP